MKLGIKEIVTYGLLIGLSAVLAFVTIPSPTGTVAFDSLPAFVGAGLLGTQAGGIIGFAGHFLTALYRGFPLGVVSHLFIGLFMALTMIVYGYFYKRNKVMLAIISSVLINGVLSLIPFIFIFNLGFVISMILPLVVASLINVVIGTIINRALKDVVIKN